MEELKDQLATFNELHSLGMEFLTQLEDAVKHAEIERDEAKDELRSVRRELDKLKETNKNISAELAKCQKELQLVQSERDNLRKTSAELGRYKDAYNRVNKDNEILRNKLDSLKTILAR